MTDEFRPLGSKYRLLSEIGRGAMGEVWRGEDAAGTPVAVKLLLPHLAKDPVMVQRFVAERSVITGIRHENLVDVRDMVVEGDTLGIVMDYVDGPDLRSYLKRVGTLAPDQVVLIGDAVARGLSALHAKHVVHRDIKPENILLDVASAPGGAPVPKITDFGISRLSDEAANQHRTVVVGTPYYMAPELVDGATPSPASDLYALGIMLYEPTCGVTPFQGKQTMAVLRAQSEREPGRPDGFPEPLWAVVSKLLQKDPAARYADADGVVRALEGVRGQVAGLSAMAALTTPPEGPVVARGATTFLAGTPTASETVLAMPGQPGFSGISAGQSVPPAGAHVATGQPYVTGQPHVSGQPFVTNPGLSQPYGVAGVPGVTYVVQQQAPQKKHGGLIGAVVGLLVIALAAGVFLLLNRNKQQTASPAASPTTTAPAAPANATTAAAAAATATATATATTTAAQTTQAAAATTTKTVIATAATTTTTTNTADQTQSDALAKLSAQRAQDLPTVPSGWWIEQLSSKYDGIYDPNEVTASGSHTFHTADIWDQYVNLKAQFDDAAHTVVVLRSTDFRGSKDKLVYWVVAVVSDYGATETGAKQDSSTTLFPGYTDEQLRKVCLVRQYEAI